MKSCKAYFIIMASLLAGGTMSAAPVSAASPTQTAAPQTARQNATLTVKGTVLDQDGQPVIGASVVEKKNPKNGVATDIDGKFSLKVAPGSKLVITYVGCETSEVGAASSVTVTLVPSAQSLEELVVMGYGVQKKKLVTGATVQVKGDDIARLNTVDALGALQSQAPGVAITQSNGFLNSGFKVNIRGIGTIGTSSPLYVIDGVAGGSIDGLNPTDIESIDVLKDAASAAIYGARAANGVILVTTKHGRAGHSQISYDGYVGWQNLYKIPTILNAQEFMAD